MMWLSGASRKAPNLCSLIAIAFWAWSMNPFGLDPFRLAAIIALPFILDPARQEVCLCLQNNSSKMPRIAVDTVSSALLSGELDLSTASIAQMVKENVDLEKTLGVSSQVAQTIRGAYEELAESTRARTGDDADLCILICCCCYVCLQCMDQICEDDDESLIEKGASSRRSSYIETAPEQHSMEEQSIEKVKPEGFPTLLELASASSDNFRELLNSKEMINREKLGYFLFGTKFGKSEADQLKECVEQLKVVGPDLIQKDEPEFQDLLQKAKGKDMKAFVKLLRLVGSAVALKHGADVAEKGLDALKLGQCGKVLCAGDLNYELDTTGLHKCTWSCPGDEMPDKVQALAADFSGSEKKINMTVQELEDTGKSFEEDAQMDPEHYEKSKIYKVVKHVDFKFQKAFSEDPLKLFQMQATNDLGSEYPNAVRYHGTCRSKDFEIAERVLFTGSNPAIPTGGIVKVIRLPGKTWFKKTLESQEVEVKYLGEKVIVKLGLV